MVPCLSAAFIIITELCERVNERPLGRALAEGRLEPRPTLCHHMVHARLHTISKVMPAGEIPLARFRCQRGYSS
jgi:hypothetical protein